MLYAIKVSCTGNEYHQNMLNISDAENVCQDCSKVINQVKAMMHE